MVRSGRTIVELAQAVDALKSAKESATKVASLSCSRRVL